MPRSFTTFITLTLILSFAFFGEAEAKRFGGGGSFGGKSSFGTSVKGSSLTPMRTPSQQASFQQNQNARQNLGNRGGFMRILGGLAIGGLIGSLLFGGAFESFNVMDMLLIGGGVFLLLRFLRSRAPTLRAAGGAPPRSAQPLFTPPIRGVPTALDGGTAGTGFGGAPNNDVEAKQAPTGFDTTAFLAGAKIAYTQLQHAWDTVDLVAIRALTTDQMFAEIQTRIKDNPAGEPTAIEHLQAELIDVVTTDTAVETIVLLDVLMREGSGGPTQAMREIWHFVQSRTGRSPRWLLDGIQQIED